MIMLTPDQVRMARTLLRLTQADLAKKAGLSRATTAAFESGRLNPRLSTMLALIDVFEREGLEFTADTVVRRSV